MGTRIAASDLTWLLMDRPNNLMHVHGLLTFDELPEWEALRDAIFEGGVEIVFQYTVITLQLLALFGINAVNRNRNDYSQRHRARAYDEAGSLQIVMCDQPIITGGHKETAARHREETCEK